jgi:hypothetical protein
VTAILVGCKTNRFLSRKVQQSDKVARFWREKKKKEDQRRTELAWGDKVTGDGTDEDADKKGSRACIHQQQEEETGSKDVGGAMFTTEAPVTEGTKRKRKMGGESSAPKIRKAIEKKGRREMPKPCDDHGCQHVGIHELKELPKEYLKVYVKRGNWLCNKPCKDCACKPEEEKDRVMDVAEILKDKKVRSDDMARYCNYGRTAHSMEEDDEFKQRFTCDMVLCKGCYKKRVDKYEVDNGSANRRSNRRRK